MARISCADCKFFSSVSPAAPYEGECRKNAPTLIDELGMAVFPRTEDGDWCGDFLRLPELYDVDDNYDDDEQDYDVELPDYNDENTADVTQQDLFDDNYNNPYQDWENKDSAIDAISLSVATLEDTSLDLETDVDSLKNFREWAMKTIEKLQKEVQIMKQPNERVGW